MGTVEADLILEDEVLQLVRQAGHRAMLVGVQLGAAQDAFRELPFALCSLPRRTWSLVELALIDDLSGNGEKGVLLSTEGREGERQTNGKESKRFHG